VKNVKLLGLRLTLELQSRVGSPVIDIPYYSAWPEVCSPRFDFFQFICAQNALPSDINLILILETEATEKNPLSSQADPAIPYGVGPITQIHNDEKKRNGTSWCGNLNTLDKIPIRNAKPGALLSSFRSGISE
jgi:hypothetical protein